MSIPGSVSPLFLTSAAAEAEAYQIDRSLRFDSSASSYLSRTPSSAGNRKTFTWSGWLKQGVVSGTSQTHIFAAGTSPFFQFYFAGPTLYVETNQGYIQPTRKFRDPSAWYHFVVAIDTTQATAANRIKFYVNGEEVTDFAVDQRSSITQNTDLSINSTVEHRIGRQTAASAYSNMYLAEVHFVDGQQLDPTSFGEYDDNNVWQPKEYSGTYGPLVDTSQTWSNGMKTTTTATTTYSTTGRTTTFPDGLSALAPFNSDLTDYLYSQTGVAGTWWFLEFATALQNVTSISFSTEFSCPGGVIKLNGTDVTVDQSNLGSGFVEVNVTGTIPSSLTEIAVQGNGGSARLQYVKINGKFLIDSGVSLPDNSFKLDFSDNSSVSALGTDSSGNGNTWTVNNFSLGDSNLTGYYYAEGYVVNNTNDAGNFNTDSSTFATFASNDSWGIYRINGSTSVNVIFKGFSTNRGFGYAFSNDPTIRNPSSVSWSSYDHGTAPGNTAVTATLSNSNGYQYLYVCGWLNNIFLPPGFNTGGDAVYFVSCNDFGTTPSGQTSILDFETDNDSLIDTPTNYTADSGNNGGNYCTWNPLDVDAGSSASNGNLDAFGNQDFTGIGGTIGVSSGKYYWEITDGAGSVVTGIWRADEPVTTIPGFTANSYGYFDGDGRVFNNSGTLTTLSTFTQGDVIGHALDMDAGTLTFYKNGTSLGTVATGLTGAYKPAIRAGNFGLPGTSSANFGQRPFAYTPPTGFLSLCTTNLPDPTIADGSTVMDVVTYTGNGSTQTISGLGFSPDLVWIKNRAAADNHKLLDTIRGATNELESNTTDAEVANADGLTAFNSDGFSLGADVEYNTSSESYVAWTWDAGSSTVSNTDGSITSQVRANPTAGFSIIGYTGNATVGATLGHGLNAAPEFMLFKNRDDTLNWYAWHQAIGNTKHMRLNTTLAATTRTEFLNSTSPTSSVITVGNDAEVNATGQDIICYAWTSVAGYSSFGSYQGNGSSDGPFVYTGHRVKWLLLKRTDSTGDWFVLDSERNLFNPTDSYLRPNLANSELDNTEFVDLLSNGFKIKATGNAYNGSGATVIYAAYAEHPFASNARAR